jgi:hypothetical protein
MTASAPVVRFVSEVGHDLLPGRSGSALRSGIRIGQRKMVPKSRLRVVIGRLIAARSRRYAE